MTNTESIVLSEVSDVLKYMNKMSVMKIPIEILEYINKNKDKEFISKIDKNDIFNKNNISKDALKILAWLDLNYLASEENKKIKLEIYKKNEIKKQELLKEKYKENDLFGKNRLKNANEINESIKESNNFEELQIVEYKESIINKFINFIKKLFN